MLTRADTPVAASWLGRLVLVLAFVPHGLGKIVVTQAFTAKFGVPTWQALTLGAVELAAAAGMALAPLLARHAGRPWGWRVTWAAAVGVWVSQVLAIGYAAWPRWLFYLGGMEYNVALILVALAVAIAPGLPPERRRR
jgi:hypothetical protein